MKKLSIVFIAAILFSCSKESELTNPNQVTVHEAQMSTTNAFKVGEVATDGTLSITYDLTELAELCACGVSENTATSLGLHNETGVGYFLQGIGSSTGSTTSFSISLDNLDGDLMWEEGAFIAMCQNATSTPCGMTIIGQESFDCTGDPATGSCFENEVGGGNGNNYPTSCGDTNWPWATKELDEDKD